VILLNGKSVFEYKAYVSPNGGPLPSGQEFFRYRFAESREELEKTAEARESFHFGDSLLDFLYYDAEGNAGLFQSVAADIKRLKESQDEGLVEAIRAKLEQISKLHIYFQLLKFDWYCRLDRRNATRDINALLPHDELANMPVAIAQRQKIAFALISEVLAFDGKDGSIQEKMKGYCAPKAGREIPPYPFTPLLTRFSLMDNAVFVPVLDRAMNIFDLLTYFLQLSVEREQVYKQCKSCGRYFALSGYSTTEYCAREYGDTGKTCREIGASVAFQRKVENEPAIAAYQKAYKKKFAHIRYKKITKDEFSAWSEIARDKRDKCVAGKLPLDEFKDWLNQ
jgi:hypothetical protein